MSLVEIRDNKLIKSHSALFMATFGANLPAKRKTLKFLGQASKHDINESDNTRERCVCLGPTIGNINLDIHSHNHTVSNWKRGIIKRCAHEQTADRKDPIFREFYDFVKDEIRRYPVLPGGLVFEELREEWLKHSRYNEKMKNKMRKCGEQVRKMQVPINKILRIQSFIKSEFYNELKECRIINSRSDWFKAYVGPYIKQVEKVIYDEHFIKHKTPKQIAEVMELTAKGYDLFYETDYSSFEGSFTLEFMKNVELRMFKRVLANYPEVVSMIQKSYSTNHVYFKGNPNISCEFEGSRMSGEMWTSLCNGFTNMMLVKFMLKKSNSIGKFLVEGDDGFIACTNELDFTIARRLGFNLKVEATSDSHQVKFCSLSTHEGRIVPDIRRVLSHYGVINDINRADAFRRNTKRSNRSLRQLMKSKAHSLLATSSGIPILQAIALQQLRCYEKDIINPKYFDYWESEFYDLFAKQKAEPITDSMREFVEKQFKIPVKKQIAIEEAIMNTKATNYHIRL